MDLTALCDMCGGENGTNGHHLAVFNVHIALASHFVATCLPPPSYPIGMLVVCIGYTSKNSLKWQAIQLATHSIVGECIDSK